MLMSTLMLGAALAAPGGARHEASLELGTLGSRDPNADLFSYSDLLQSGGGRLGYAVADQWTVVADYQFGRHGDRLEADSGDGGYSLSLMDLTLHQLTVGPKFSLELTPWLRPYATVQAMGVAGRLRLGEDPDEPEDRARFWSMAPGGVAALGVDLSPGKKRQAVRFGSHLEMGYGYATALSFSDRDAGNDAAEIGDMRLGGFYLRWGVGVRF